MLVPMHARAEDTSRQPKAEARATSKQAKRLADDFVETLTPDADARKIEVRLTSNGISMPKSVPAGKTAFVVKNVGKEKQNFEVEGDRIGKKFRVALAPQETKVFQMTLKPGKYKAYCTGLNGEKKRVEVSLTVR